MWWNVKVESIFHPLTLYSSQKPAEEVHLGQVRNASFGLEFQREEGQFLLVIDDARDKLTWHRLDITHEQLIAGWHVS